MNDRNWILYVSPALVLIIILNIVCGVVLVGGTLLSVIPLIKALELVDQIYTGVSKVVVRAYNVITGSKLAYDESNTHIYNWNMGTFFKAITNSIVEIRLANIYSTSIPCGNPFQDAMGEPVYSLYDPNYVPGCTFYGEAGYSIEESNAIKNEIVLGSQGTGTNNTSPNDSDNGAIIKYELTSFKGPSCKDVLYKPLSQGLDSSYYVQNTPEYMVVPNPFYDYTRPEGLTIKNGVVVDSNWSKRIIQFHAMEGTLLNSQAVQKSVTLNDNSYSKSYVHQIADNDPVTGEQKKDPVTGKLLTKPETKLMLFKANYQVTYALNVGFARTPLEGYVLKMRKDLLLNSDSLVTDPRIGYYDMAKTDEYAKKNGVETASPDYRYYSLESTAIGIVISALRGTGSSTLNSKGEARHVYAISLGKSDEEIDTFLDDTKSPYHKQRNDDFEKWLTDYTSTDIRTDYVLSLEAKPFTQKMLVFWGKKAPGSKFAELGNNLTDGTEVKKGIIGIDGKPETKGAGFNKVVEEKNFAGQDNANPSWIDTASSYVQNILTSPAEHGKVYNNLAASKTAVETFTSLFPSSFNAYDSGTWDDMSPKTNFTTTLFAFESSAKTNATISGTYQHEGLMLDDNGVWQIKGEDGKPLVFGVTLPTIETYNYMIVMPWGPNPVASGDGVVLPKTPAEFVESGVPNVRTDIPGIPKGQFGRGAEEVALGIWNAYKKAVDVAYDMCVFDDGSVHGAYISKPTEKPHIPYWLTKGMYEDATPGRWEEAEYRFSNWELPLASGTHICLPVQDSDVEGHIVNNVDGTTDNPQRVAYPVYMKLMCYTEGVEYTRAAEQAAITMTAEQLKNLGIGPSEKDISQQVIAIVDRGPDTYYGPENPVNGEPAAGKSVYSTSATGVIDVKNDEDAGFLTQTSASRIVELFPINPVDFFRPITADSINDMVDFSDPFHGNGAAQIGKKSIGPTGDNPNAPVGKPLDILRVTQEYGYYGPDAGIWAGAWHPGIDFAADIGTPVYATHDGIVTVTGTGGGGLVLEVDSSYVGVDGKTYYVRTRYAHLSAATVSTGDIVKQRDQIALSGNSGTMTTGPHLHYEVHISTDLATVGNTSTAENPRLWIHATIP